MADHRAIPSRAARRLSVVHHLSTPERRIEAVNSILQTLRPGGKALIYVWALDQGGSRRGWTEGGEQDVMVPWVMRGSKKLAQAESAGQSVSEDRTFHRYYHLYRKGELESDVVQAGGEVVEAGYEKDNWWVVATPRQST
ncbi:tRNA methyltransferase, has a role in tRNA modification [Elasticomyces elasticus]|nr:tRNA methyltransferase, has a role in tRNA modification [Elasticomyces elasticus]KAK4980629.1 tRNA methyltransferase, has a role in tRNA modification [Elasticomyces elasticus]